MPVNRVPSPRVTQPGQWPKIGQASTYQAENGDEFPCQISWVGAKNPDQTRCSVQATFLIPVVGREESPWKRTESAWQYDKATGKVFYDPCGPPW